MLIADTLNPPIQYSIIWFIIGCCLLLSIPAWYGALYWMTRRVAVKTLENLRQLPPEADLEKLKLKYLKLIDELFTRYQRKEITLRALHRGLSMTVRYFVYEANHFPAPTLTLSDLMIGPYPKLTNIIAKYYPEEFATVTRGNAGESVEAAKGLILQWV